MNIIAQMRQDIAHTKKMENQIIELLRQVDPEQVLLYKKDVQRVRKFYTQFIETFPTALQAREWIRCYSKSPAAERLLQQQKLRIFIDEAKKDAPPLLKWYLDVCRYRDHIELIISWLAPYARRFAYTDKDKTPDEIGKSIKEWTIKHQMATDIIDILRKACSELLDELLAEMDFDARNAFSHADYYIDIDKERISFNDRKGKVVEWTRDDFDVKISTVWTYYATLYIQWPQVFLPLIIAELEAKK